MDKIGHLVMTKSLSGNIHRAHKAALLFGSILPDLLVYTYLEGHTWEATFEQITKQMKALEAKGRGGSFSYLKLGWILHYVDQTSWSLMLGNVTKFVRYEKKLTSLCQLVTL